MVVDAQQAIGPGYSNPRSVAARINGTVYVAEQNNNRVLPLVYYLPSASTKTQVATTGYTLAGPTGVVVDQNGGLFIGDYPNILGIGVTRIIECLATKGVLDGNVNLIYQGGLGVSVESAHFRLESTGKIPCSLASRAWRPASIP